MPLKKRSVRIKILLGLIALILIHFLIQWLLGRYSFLSESFYDEAVTGEMALHILKGEPQLFFWGQPYMGALEAYLTSFLFYLFGPSAQILHLTIIIMMTVNLLLVFRIGTTVGGWKVGILAAAYWAISPLYLSIVGQLATGGHVESCAAGLFVLLGIGFLTVGPAKNPVALAVLIGLIAGLGWWSSLLATPFLAAGVIGLVITRPRMLFSWVPGAGVGGFLLGSSPFWVWQLSHDFSTFRFFAAIEAGPVTSFFFRFYVVLRYSLIESFLGYWWDGHSVLPSVPSFLAGAVFFIIYLPAFLLFLTVIFQWIRRILSRRNPFQDAKDLVVLTFGILILFFSSSEQGAHGSLRYSLALYGPFSILLALWLSRTFRFRKDLGWVLLGVLLVFNLFLHYLFLQEFTNLPYRPVDQLINVLKDKGIRYVYAQDRISQVLTFESREEIICSDFFGQRNFNYLQAVDEAPIKKVALVTHQNLGRPFPESLSDSLRLLGGSSQRVEVGPYVFWYDFKEPVYPLRSLSPKEWRITANQEMGQVEMITDRDILTAWKVLKRAGDHLTVDLGKTRTVARLSLLPGPIGFGLPSGLKIETSLDQKKWEKVAESMVNDMPGCLAWYQGRPRMDWNPRLQISFSPRPVRYIRLTNLTVPENPNELWTIAELFIYETSDSPVNPSLKAHQAYNQAQQVLKHWMDDPTGPHPLFPFASSETRRKQVQWQTAFQSLQEAIQEAPDWEEPHFLLGETVDRGELWNKGGHPRSLKSINFNDLFPRNDRTKISPARFNVFSSSNNNQAKLAIDGNPLTRWGSSKGQEPGMFFQVDLGRGYSVNGLSLFLGSALNDYPRNLKIVASLDEKHWQDVPADSQHIYAFSENQIYKKTVYSFPPIQARYFKLIQLGKDPTYWWSIYELDVFGEEVHSPVPSRSNKGS